MSNLRATRWDAININANGASIIAIKGSCKDLINGSKGKYRHTCRLGWMLTDSFLVLTVPLAANTCCNA